MEIFVVGLKFKMENLLIFITAFSQTQRAG